MIPHEIRAKIGQIATWMQSFPQVGGITKLIDVEVTVDTSAYASGDVMGALLTVPGVRKKGSSGIITSIEVLSELGSEDFKVFAFTEDITVAADNAAFAPTQVDMEKLIPLADDGASINLNVWETIGSHYASSKNNINAPFNVASDEENLYILLVANGAITYAATDDLHLRVGILLD